MISVGRNFLIIDRNRDLFFGDFLAVNARVFGRSPEEVIEKAREISSVLEPENDFSFRPNFGGTEGI